MVGLSIPDFSFPGKEHPQAGGGAEPTEGGAVGDVTRTLGALTLGGQGPRQGSCKSQEHREQMEP